MELVAPEGGMATEANCEWSPILPEWSGQWGLGAPSLRGRGFDPLGGRPQIYDPTGQRRGPEPCDMVAEVGPTGGKS